MNLNLESLSTLELQRIADLGDPFEAAWRAGWRPRIEAVLSGALESERSPLLGVLLAQEWEIRVELGEAPTIQEYRARFPGQDEVIFNAINALIVPGDGLERAVGDATLPLPSGCADRASAPVWASPLGKISSTGRFRIHRPHAQGGLGEIFVAHDGELDRDVAVKQILPGSADDPESRSRFVREAMVTGRLEHPGIVPVYGLGRDAAGRPFYAMRYVKGDTLAEVIRRFHEGAKAGGKPAWRRAEFRELLGRFLDVCNVIDYAHSRGVIHRDVKPRNIMLGPFGETLVLDWGLAKELMQPGEQPDSEPGASLSSPGPLFAGTIPGMAVGTPEFMSPEQAAGQPGRVGPANDVYSLGATFYCLLTDRPPFRDPDPNLTLEKVRRGAFPLPRAIDPTIPRPLEAICRKAMALEPAARYASPHALAEDLERWLADEPVSAWREPWSTNVRRRLAQHRTMATTGVALVVLAAVALGSFAVYQRRANTRLADMNRDLQTAKQRAESSRGRAEERVELALRAVEHFHGVVTQHVDVRNRPELAPLRKELLQAPREFYRLLIEGIQNNPESRPETLAKLAEALLGLVQITTLIDSEAQALQLDHKAVAVLDQLARDQPAVPNYRFALAKALATLATLEHRAGRSAESLASGERARGIYHDLARDDPTDERYPSGLAEVETHLGLLHREGGRLDQARATYQHTQVLLQHMVRDHPANGTYQSELGQVLRNLGVLYRASRQPRAALASYEHARAIFQGLVRDHPAVVHYRKGLADCLFNLGNVHGIDLNQSQPALENYQAARALEEELVREQPSVAEYRAALAHTHGQIAAYPWLVAPAERLASLERARDLLEGLVRENPEVIRYRTDLAMTHYFISGRQRDFRRLTEALASLVQARGLSEKLARDLPADSTSWSLLGAIWEDEGSLLTDLGRSQDVELAYEQAIRHQRLAYNKADSKTRFKRESAVALMHHLEKLAEFQSSQNRPDEAIQSWLRAHEVLAELPGPTFQDYFADARICSRSCSLIGRGRRNLTAAEQAQRQVLADLGMVALRRAATAGLSFEALRADASLNSLRERADFQMLLMDLAFPPNPFRDDPENPRPTARRTTGR
jgi:serine/threonine-protein kinase